MSLCPRCHQDEVGRYGVLATADEVWLCPECEALWPGSNEPPVTLDGFTQFLGKWSEVELLRPPA